LKCSAEDFVNYFSYDFLVKTVQSKNLLQLNGSVLVVHVGCLQTTVCV